MSIIGTPPDRPVATGKCGMCQNIFEWSTGRLSCEFNDVKLTVPESESYTRIILCRPCADKVRDFIDANTKDKPE